MSKNACPRLFEVEAMRDGRLGDAERASFERHLRTCTACTREAEALEALARAVRASAGAHEDELHVRRERNRLLAAFDRELVRDRRAPRRWWIAAAGVAIVAGTLAAWRVSIGSVPSAPPDPSPPLASAIIEANDAALYSRQVEGRRERIVLQRGELRIRITHPPGHEGGALVVSLPDGELEDVGTTFTVAAAEDRTTHVAVDEGSIVLRLRDRPPIVLRAGETWRAELRPPPSSTPTPAPSPSAVPSPPAADASKDFRDAMAALAAGDHRGAAARFARFLDTHPRDPRAEDAAYLRVVALHRAGAVDETKAAARFYLERYPSGFRRAEVEQLVE